MNQGSSKSIRVQKGQRSKPGVSNPTIPTILMHFTCHELEELFLCSKPHFEFLFVCPGRPFLWELPVRPICIAKLGQVIDHHGLRHYPSNCITNLPTKIKLHSISSPIKECLQLMLFLLYLKLNFSITISISAKDRESIIISRRY